ncbi:putative ABC-class ATPase [Virgibacillus natechei]|uniref:ABC-class ATPase n=1 Tax=Virgibacillus natechei TaxID=1216297 RepID=A0ABS4II62_9BACI|nr:ABC-ATPase domain-containing protein [Virgibacillus natechei]MBP1970136.1 putative ABC-class ATPase [Virgibacillus natechei]UZD14209.1 ABC-ATPase domain-containing protein [Virgibacillus natechei]
MKKLLQQLKQLDNKSYKAYKDVQGHYSHDDYELYIDYVQGDPFATPSKIRVVIGRHKRSVKTDWLQSYSRKTATENIIAHTVGKAIANHQFSIKGTGKSGAILFDSPGQEVLERSAVQITSESITVCISVGLPANGRKINGREAEKLFAQAIPTIIQNSIFTITDKQIVKAIKLADQQDAIRLEMQQNNWISFIANGSILPRASGVSNRPLQKAIPFHSPSENEVSIDIPHQIEPIKGMAIKKGITLIVGGGYHGKSTLLQGIERGVYSHVEGDGREYVLTDPDAVKIRAEDGRKITGVNISPFINNLPHGQDTQFFSTENASGSTSQSANVMEALEVGATTLLIDEDTSATNFMIRDHRMQQLVVSDKEPITPFIDKVKQMRDQLDVSTVLVMGGSGDYFAVADSVIMMEAYAPHNVTTQARDIMEAYPLERDTLSEDAFGSITNRYFKQNTLQTKKGNRSKTQARGLSKISMGRIDIEFDDTEQLVDPSQTRMIAEIIQYLDRPNALQRKSLNELLTELEQQIDTRGLASFTTFKNQHPGDIARPRRYEIAAVLNRIRTANVNQK